MIRHAVFSWKRHGRLTLLESCLWRASAEYARRSGLSTVFVGDQPAREAMSALGVPFDWVLDLPPIPDELESVRDLVKLTALKISLLNLGPSVHVDFDAFLGKPLPDRVLEATCCGEYFYPLPPFVADLQARMPVPLLKSPTQGLAAGIMGGCDVSGLLSAIDESLRVGLLPENRAALTGPDTNGYQSSVLIGEAAFAHAFPAAEQLLQRGPHFREDYEALCYVHVAGRKFEAKPLECAVEDVFRNDFPQAFSETVARWMALN